MRNIHGMNNVSCCGLICPLRRIASAALGLLWLGALAGRAATNYVVPPGTAGVTPTPAYLTWDTAATNIQWAVNAATNGNTVLVTNGSYCLTNQVMITNRITVKSVNGYSNTFVYADWPARTTRCFYVSRTGVVDGFTISNGHCIGNTYDGGAGAFITTNGVVQNCYFKNNLVSNGYSYGHLGAAALIVGSGVLSNCIAFSNIFAYTNANYGYDIGGAVCVRDGGGYILDCTIISNHDTSGGGAGFTLGTLGFFYPTQSTLISNCVSAYHRAGEGIGIYGESYAGSLVEIVNCTFRNNNVGIRAASGALTRACLIRNNLYGLYCNSATGTFLSCTSINNSFFGLYIQEQNVGPVLDSCVFSRTTSGRGCQIEAPSIVRNCLISSNYGSIGGGVYLKNNSKYTTGGQTSGLFNCTIVSNYASVNGGGICTTGTLNNIVNCIIASNRTAGSHSDVYDSNSSPVNSNKYYNCCSPATNAEIFATGKGNITDDPAFVNATGNNWRLNANSPCVNTGTNQDWMTNAVDLDGRQRIRYGTVDMGAYETIYNGIFITVP